MREKLVELLDEPDQLPDGVDEPDVLALIASLTIASHGWLER